jgi:hypothetical protein
MHFNYFLENEQVLSQPETPARRVYNVFHEKLISITFWLIWVQWFVGAGKKLSL